MTGTLFKEEEMERICVIKKLLERRYTQKEAGIELGVSERSRSASSDNYSENYRFRKKSSCLL